MAKNMKEAIVGAIAAGKHKSREQLAKAAGINALALSTALGALRREGVIDYTKPHPRAIDYPSMVVVGELTAGAAAPKKPRSKKAAKPSRRTARAAKPAAAPSVSLEDCISVNYTPAEVAALVELEAGLQTALASVSSIVAALRTSPALGPKGAAAMQFLATMLRDEAKPARGRVRASARRPAPTSAPASKGSDEEE